MEEILNNLKVGDVLHTTNRNTLYSFIRRSADGGIIYSIKKNRKTLPLKTINFATEATKNGVIISRQWYREYNLHEYNTSPCNFSVLKNILLRI